jgi:hypothetical protein
MKRDKSGRFVKSKSKGGGMSPQQELSNWHKIFTKRMQGIRKIMNKYGSLKTAQAKREYKKLPKLPNTTKAALRLSKRAHESI